MSKRVPKGPVLIVAQHQGLYTAFHAILSRNGLEPYEQDAFTLSDALTALRTGEPKAILMLENGYEVERRGAIHRYQIVEGITQAYPEVPLIYCADNADRGFFDWATALGVTVLTPLQPGKASERDIIAALKAVLKGAEPSIVAPPPEEKPKRKGFLTRVTEEGIMTPRKRERPAEKASAPEPEAERSPLEVPSGEPTTPFGAQDDRMTWQGHQSDAEGPRITGDAISTEPEEGSMDIPAAIETEVMETAMSEMESSEDVILRIPEPVAGDETAVQGEEQISSAEEESSLLPKPRLGLGSLFERGRTERASESEKKSAGGSLSELTGRFLRSASPDSRADKPTFQDRNIIGVFALTRGAGATRMAYDLANYFKNTGPTALVAMDGKQDLDYVPRDERINVHVPAVSQVSTLLAMLVGSRMYQFIVCDFGTPVKMHPNGMPYSYALSELEQMLNELRRCDYRICCTSHEPWHQRKEAYLKHLALHDSLMVNRAHAQSPQDIVQQLYRSRPQLLR